MQAAEVETQFGPVRGRVTNAGTRIFLGVPYAATTAGVGRFAPARPPKSWRQPRPAMYAGPSSPQPDPVAAATAAVIRPGTAAGVSALYQQWGVSTSVDQRQSEDCLTVSIWTPGISEGLRPVIVWFHGGGWASGSAAWPWSDGTNLCARGDLVVVAVNHRLGITGYLHLGEQGDPYFDQSGAAGADDLVTALRWIRDNIAAFGGDPKNVTIFGQSGGAEKVAAMFALPAAAGLFHKAIMSSGVGGSTFVGRSHARAVTRTVMAELQARTIADLQNVPVRRLIDLQLVLSRRAELTALRRPTGGIRRMFQSGWMIFNPMLGDDIATNYLDVMAHNQPGSDVPLLIGTTADEAALMHPAMAGPELDQSGLTESLRMILGTETAHIIEEYRAADARLDTRDLLCAIMSDHIFRIPSVRLAERRAQTSNAPVYMYSLAWGTPSFGGRRKAVHTLDIPLVFGNVDKSPFCAASSGAVAVSEQMCDAWIAFARTGRPAQSSLPDWPRYDLRGRATMIFDADSHVEYDPARQQREIWQDVAATQLGLTGELG